MNYITFGKRENPCVVFLHGWGGSVKSFMGVAKVFAGFGFFAVLIDFDGFGDSPEPNEPKTIYDYADDVEEFIDKFGLVSPMIIGHSFGGRVGVILSARGLVRKLVLVDSAGLRPRFSFSRAVKVWKYKRCKKKVVAGKLSSEKLLKFGSSDYKVLSSVMKATFVNVVNEDLFYLLPKIKVPTLLVWGKKDKDTPLYMARRFQRTIENSRLLVYNAGHYSYLECSGRFIEDVYDFLI